MKELTVPSCENSEERQRNENKIAQWIKESFVQHLQNALKYKGHPRL